MIRWHGVHSLQSTQRHLLDSVVPRGDPPPRFSLSQKHTNWIHTSGSSQRLLHQQSHVFEMDHPQIQTSPSLDVFGATLTAEPLVVPSLPQQQLLHHPHRYYISSFSPEAWARPQPTDKLQDQGPTRKDHLCCLLHCLWYPFGMVIIFSYSCCHSSRKWARRDALTFVWRGLEFKQCIDSKNLLGETCIILWTIHSDLSTDWI